MAARFFGALTVSLAVAFAASRLLYNRKIVFYTPVNNFTSNKFNHTTFTNQAASALSSHMCHKGYKAVQADGVRQEDGIDIPQLST